MYLTARGCVIALSAALGVAVLFFWVTGMNAANANPPPPPTPEAAKPPPVLIPATPPPPAPPAATVAESKPAPANPKKPMPAMKAALLAPPGPAMPTSHVKKDPHAKTKAPAKHAIKHSGKSKKTKTAKR